MGMNACALQMFLIGAGLCTFQALMYKWQTDWWNSRIKGRKKLRPFTQTMHQLYRFGILSSGVFALASIDLFGYRGFFFSPATFMFFQETVVLLILVSDD